VVESIGWSAFWRGCIVVASLVLGLAVLVVWIYERFFHRP